MFSLSKTKNTLCPPELELLQHLNPRVNSPKKRVENRNNSKTPRLQTPGPFREKPVRLVLNFPEMATRISPVSQFQMYHRETFSNSSETESISDKT